MKTAKIYTSDIYVTNTNANMNKNKYKCWLNLNVFYKLKGTTNYQAIYYFFPSHFEKKDGDIENLNGHVVQIEWKSKPHFSLLCRGSLWSFILQNQFIQNPNIILKYSHTYYVLHIKPLVLAFKLKHCEIRHSLFWFGRWPFLLSLHEQ